MKALMGLFGIGLTLLCAACIGPPVKSDSGLTPVSATDSAREILVTFVDRGLQRTPNGGPGQYFPHGGDYQSTTWSRRVTADIARDYRLTTVTQWPIRTLGIQCVVFSVGDNRPVDELIARLSKDRRIEAAQPMNTFRALSSDDPYKPLQTSFSAMHVEAVHRWTTGRNVRVAIIDTGIDVTHPDLAGQFEQRADLTDGRSAFEDDIHGTAVAGIIGAVSQNGQGIEGVAPDARLIALRACWPERAGEIGAMCNSLTLAKALDSAILMKPHVVNLSLTGPHDPLIETLVRTAVRAGIILVVAEPDTGESSGFATGIEGVIRVRDDHASADGQRRQGDAGTVIAPGSEVLTTFPRGTYNFASGSSFAAANVSGVVALLLELKPGLSSSQASELLSNDADGKGGKDAMAAHFNVCKIVSRLRPEFECDNQALSAMLAMH